MCNVGLNQYRTYWSYHPYKFLPHTYISDLRPQIFSASALDPHFRMSFLRALFVPSNQTVCNFKLIVWSGPM